MSAKGTKNRRGRLAKLTMPEPLNAPPERIVEVVLRAKPKTEWRYLKEQQGGK